MEEQRIPEKIISSREVNGHLFYLIKWQGKEEAENSWEIKTTLGKNFNELEKRYQIERENKEKKQIIKEENRKKKKSDKKKFILQFGKINNLQVSIDDMYGDLEAGDKPKAILKSRKLDKEIEFIVEWMPRTNKFQPKESVVTNTELKKFCPEVLLKFYEDNMVFKDKQLIQQIEN